MLEEETKRTIENPYESLRDDPSLTLVTGEKRVCFETLKVCFHTKTQTRNARRMLELRYLKSFQIYICNHCGYFHLTTCDSRYDKNKS